MGRLSHVSHGAGGGVACHNPETTPGIGAVKTVASLSSWEATPEPIGALSSVSQPGLGDMVQANRRTGDYAWYTTQLSAAQGATLLQETSSNLTIRAFLYAETVAYLFVDDQFVGTLSNEEHNGSPHNLTTIASVNNLRTAVNVSILASCVGLSADHAGVGDVGRAGVSAVYSIGAVGLAQNQWRMQPHLSGSPLVAGAQRGDRGVPVGEGVAAVRAVAVGPAPVPAGPMPCSFPISRSYPIECLGLVANHAGDASAAACERSCCEAGATCGAWQWGATASNCSATKSSACGCWLGQSCERTGIQGFWLGGARLPPPPAQGTKPVWLRATFDVPANIATNLPLALDLGHKGVDMKGHLYINGFDCGRLWYGTKPHLVQRFYQLPPDHLRPSGNVLVLFDELASSGATLNLRVVAAT